MRAQALCDKHAKIFEAHEDPVRSLPLRNLLYLLQLRLKDASHMHFERHMIWAPNSGLLSVQLASNSQRLLFMTLLVQQAILQSQRSFFSEIISSISDMRFSRDGRFILARDFMSLKLWDINMERKPLAVFPVHEYLRSKVNYANLLSAFLTPTAVIHSQKGSPT